MQQLMTDPFRVLDTRDNSSLMMIFEAYRNLRDDNAALKEKLRSEIECRYAAELEAEEAEKRWQQEKTEYRTEVKRLEILIAKGKRGLADVMRARQDSMLQRGRRRESKETHNDQKETVFEFLERTRAEDLDARLSQRGLSSCFLHG